MDIALYQELVNHAQKLGCDDVAIIARHIIQNAIANTNSAAIFKQFEDATLAIQIGNASASVQILNNAIQSDRTTLLQTVKNLCQAAKIAKTWGSNAPSTVHDIVKQFNLWPESTDITCDSYACTNDALQAEAPQVDTLPSHNPTQVDLSDISQNLQFSAQTVTAAVQETLFHNQKILTHTTTQSTLFRKLTLRHVDQDISLNLPLLRFNPYIAEQIPDDSAQIDEIRETAQHFYNSECSQLQYVSPMPQILISGWGMAVLGHEAAHLNKDIAVSGKIIAEIAQCSNTPCPILGFMPSEQTQETQQNSVSVPPYTLMVDAPDLWIRKNQHLLDIRFRIACEMEHTKIIRYFKPVTLRIDLNEIWNHIQMAISPVKTICLKCHKDFATFSAPACLIAKNLNISTF